MNPPADTVGTDLALAKLDDQSLKIEISQSVSAACLASRARVPSPSLDSIWRRRFTNRNVSLPLVAAPLIVSSHLRISDSSSGRLRPDRAATRAAISARGLLLLRPAWRTNARRTRP